MVRYALRSLRRGRRFSVAVLLSLAAGTGIGLSTGSLVARGLGAPNPTPAVAGIRVPVDPGVSLAPRREPTALGRLLGETPGWGSARMSATQAERAGLAALLRTLAATVALTLLVAALDVLLLMLARASVRRPDLAMRRVLGGRRRGLAGLLATEGAILGAAGAAAGVAGGWAGVLLLRAGWPEGLARWLDAAPPLTILLPAALAPLALATAGSLLPLLPTTGRSLHQQVAGGARATAGPREGRLRDRLSMLAVASSVVLLTGAGVLLRSFGAPSSAAAGPDPTDTLTLQLELPTASAAERARTLEAVLAGVSRIPGVEAESASSPGAWVGVGTQELAHAILDIPDRPGIVKPARYHAVSPGYFSALGLRVAEGREFTSRDRQGEVPVVVISEVFARRLFPSGGAVGKRVQLGGLSLRGTAYRVVGIVQDVRLPGLAEGSEPVPAIYLSALQHPPHAVGLTVRGGEDPLALLPAVERALHDADPRLAPLDPLTMEERLARHREPIRWLATLFAVLAALATLLAAGGLYGVVSYAVSQRRREIGIRMAVGARARAVAGMVVRQGVRTAGVGAVWGVAGALCLARLLEYLFHGVEALDPTVYAGVVGLLLTVAILASLRPALAATRVDPLVALRAD